MPPYGLTVQVWLAVSKVLEYDVSNVTSQKSASHLNAHTLNCHVVPWPDVIIILRGTLIRAPALPQNACTSKHSPINSPITSRSF